MPKPRLDITAKRDPESKKVKATIVIHDFEFDGEDALQLILKPESIKNIIEGSDAKHGYGFSVETVD